MKIRDTLLQINFESEIWQLFACHSVALTTSTKARTWQISNCNQFWWIFDSWFLNLTPELQLHNQKSEIYSYPHPQPLSPQSARSSSETFAEISHLVQKWEKSRYLISDFFPLIGPGDDLFECPGNSKENTFTDILGSLLGMYRHVRACTGMSA